MTRIFDCIKEGSYLPEETQPDGVDDIVLTEGSDQEDDDNAGKSLSSEEKLVSKFNDNDKSKHLDHATTASDSKSLPAKTDGKSNNSTSRLSRRRISPPLPGSERDRYVRGAQPTRSPVRNRRGTSSTYNSSRGNRSDRYHRRRSWSRSRSRSPKSRSRSRSPHRFLFLNINS